MCGLKKQRRGRGHKPISGSLIEQVQGVVRSEYTSAHHSLGLEIFEGLISITIRAKIIIPTLKSGAIRSSKGLRPAVRATRG